ncbi:RNA methyltransferase [Kingella negevensis]|uniref:TrmH family RNA methyltransferase n=1 Tax=Kingella negevensis TaxID=1522312 RepID=UPI00254E4A57|nr:RNA methyltransferase [Kingella negevensis]MDK4708149.1 RNA methyltransferase [Kingella negevensis]MDK4709714.1 RNA methyltransferase [Kingella negevensis]
MQIQSPQNPQIKHLSKLLAERKHRREHGQTVLEGAHLLTTYLDAGKQPERIYIPESRLTQPEIQKLLFRLPTEQVTTVSDGILKKISSLDNADDIMALINLPPQTQPENTDCIVLERVQDAGNVGTVLRSAAASGIRTVILGEGCADAYAPKVLRAGMGAHFLLNIHERVNLAQWRSQYSHRVLATALTKQNNYSLYELDLRQPSAWLFGNEGAGVSAEMLVAATFSVKIPMLGETESLNIAMAATVCLFEQMRQRIAA